MPNKVNKCETSFAPSEVVSSAEVLNSYHLLRDNPQIRMFQEAMPDIALIINKQRQLVYANSHLLAFLHLEQNEIPIGERLGKLLNCIHSNENLSGCGTTESCRFCGVVNAILDCQATGIPVTHEARITAGTGDDAISYDLKVKASPLVLDDQQFTIMCINDISDRKRRGILETSYFNGIYNTAVELQQMVRTLRENEISENNLTLLQAAEKINFDLMEDLISQKSLNDAEEGRLELSIGKYCSVDILKELEQYFAYQQVASGKRLFIDPFSHSVKFESDIQILKRALTNLIRNAFEAIKEGMIVKTGVRLNDKVLRYWIYSPFELAPEVKHQIFQRSFSTKGIDRGVGAYSARLLVTRYLKGRIYFNSDSCGTTFFIEIPLSLNQDSY